jgi:GNAT superfamily N-acetyltransferase
LLDYRVTLADRVSPYVYSAWLRSAWDARPSHSDPLGKDDWHRYEHARIEALSRRPGWALHVLTSDSEPWWLGGFVASELAGDECAVHWVNVKGPWRRQGLARALVACACAHHGVSRWVAASWHPRWTPRLEQRQVRTDVRLARVVDMPGDVLMVRFREPVMLPGTGSFEVNLWRRETSNRTQAIYDPEQRAVVFVHPDYETCALVPFENIASIRLEFDHPKEAAG